MTKNKIFYRIYLFRETLKMLVDDIIFHLHKNDVTMAKKLVTQFFEISMLKTIDSSLETSYGSDKRPQTNYCTIT